MNPTVLVAYEGMQILDLTGPSSVFGMANDLVAARPYRIVVAGARGGTVRSACGVEVAVTAVADIDPAGVDAFFVVGGGPGALTAAGRETRLAEWTCAAARHARRYGSICAGSLLLAEWGLVAGRRVATHWLAVAGLRARHPDLHVDAEAIFVEDGPVWTSAGVTTGIDMCLAIVERDHGSAVAQAIARRLVLSVRRPGYQSQFSPLIDAQAGGDGRYRDLIGWIALNLAGDLGVEALAARAGQTQRSFHRHFTAATGLTPAEFVRRQRLDRARDAVRSGRPLKQVAAECGFGSPEHLSTAFRKAFGMSAGEFRAVHGGRAADSARPL